MESKRLKNPANKTGRKEKGKKPVSDVWCRLLICSCGCTFNRKVWHTTSKGTQYGYMCYSQIRNGTIRTRLKKGLPTDGICTSRAMTKLLKYAMWRVTKKPIKSSFSGYLMRLRWWRAAQAAIAESK